MPLTHSEVVARLLAARANVSSRQVADAFLASLSTRRVDLRSALGSYAFALHFPQHSFQPFSSWSYYFCSICRAYDVDEDVDFDALSSERHKWGGVNHLDPLYAAFDLEQFNRMHVPEVRDEDLGTLRRILETITDLDSIARPTQLVKALAGAFPSNKDEREVVVSILGYAGILATPGHASFFHEFVPYHHRKMPPVHKTDWEYPLWYWRAEYGIDRDALAFWFPEGTAL